MRRTKKIKFSPGKTTTREKRRITQRGGELVLKRYRNGRRERGRALFLLGLRAETKRTALVEVVRGEQ